MTVTPVSPGETLTERVAEEIRAYLGRRRMSQAHLARSLGQSQMWVSDRLRGTQPIDLNDLQRIADVLGVSVLDLLPRRPTAGYLPGAKVIATIGADDRRKRRPPIIRPGIDAPPNRPVTQTRPTSRIANQPLRTVAV